MNSQFSNIVFFALLIAAAYFLLIRPQQQQRQRRDRMLSALKPGAGIVTIGGIYGTVVEMYEDRVRIRVASGAELEVARAGIGQVSDSVSEDYLPPAEDSGDLPDTVEDSSPESGASADE